MEVFLLMSLALKNNIKTHLKQKTLQTVCSSMGIKAIDCIEDSEEISVVFHEEVIGF